MKKWISLITPFNKDKNLDITSLKRYLEFITQYNFDGFLIAGSVGEGFLLSIEEIKTYIKTFRKISSKPIMLGTVDFNFDRLQEKTKLDADYLLATPPIYFKPHQQAIIKHFKNFASCDKKLFLYNNPSRVSVAITDEIYQELCQEEHIIGIKECDDKNFANRCAKFSKWQWLTGNDDFVSNKILKQGNNGIVSTIGNIIPHLLIKEQFQDWDKLCKIVYSLPNPIIVKLMLHQWKIIDKPIFRAPFDPVPLFNQKLAFKQPS